MFRFSEGACLPIILFQNDIAYMFHFHDFYPARVRKSLALKTLVSAAD